jgi:myosin heavy subunit
MRSVQFTEMEIGEVLDCVVAVLKLGNVVFAERDNDVAPTFESNECLADCSELLGVDLITLVKALTKKSIKV